MMFGVSCWDLTMGLCLVNPANRKRVYLYDGSWLMARGSRLGPAHFRSMVFRKRKIKKRCDDMRLTIINNHEYLFDQVFKNLPLKAPKKTISSI